MAFILFRIWHISVLIDIRERIRHVFRLTQQAIDTSNT